MSEGLRELLAAQLLKDEDPEISNLRDITDLLLFDPKDPIDYGAATVAASGIGAIPAGVTIAGNRLRKLGKLLKAATVPTDASRKLSEDKARKLANFYKAQFAGETAEELVPGVDGMAKGGLADLPVQQLNPGGIALRALFQKGKDAFKRKPKKDAEKVSKTDFPKSGKEKSPLTFNPLDDIRGVRDKIAALLARENVRKGIRATGRTGFYLGAPTAAYFTGKALLGEDASEEKKGGEDFTPEVKEPKSFLEKLKDMDPALARALIAGGAKMLQPTEGPVRSFLGLGEFGEGFSESLAASEAGKSDTQQLYETYLRSVPEGQAPLDIIRFADTLKQTSDDRRQQRSDILAYLQENQEAPKDATLSDFIIEKERLAEIGIDYQGEKDPSISELLIRYSGPERESIINLAVSEATFKD